MLHSQKMLPITVILLLLLVPVLSGCYTPAGRSTGQVVDDTTIGTKVKAKLFDEDSLSGFAIDVQVFEGTVTLTGAVDSTDDKAQAERVTRSVRGVTDVNNLLKVR